MTDIKICKECGQPIIPIELKKELLEYNRKLNRARVKKHREKKKMEVKQDEKE